MEITARVSELLPLATGVSGAGNAWQKATVIVEWQDGQYVKKLALSNMKKAEEFANLLIGQEYTFKIDVTSRKYNDKWYHDVTCYAWQPVGQQQAVPQPQQPYAQPAQQPYTQPAYPQQPPQQYPPQQPYQPAPMYNPAQQPYVQPPQQDAPF